MPARSLSGDPNGVCRAEPPAFLGIPLRNLHGDREQTNLYFLPNLELLIDALARADAAGFSACLEELLITETGFVARFLSGLGIKEAAELVLPSRVG